MAEPSDSGGQRFNEPEAEAIPEVSSQSSASCPYETSKGNTALQEGVTSSKTSPAIGSCLPESVDENICTRFSEAVNISADPFEIFSKTATETTEQEKRSLIQSHPVQPKSKPGKPINLPFDVNRVYAQEDTQDQRLWLSYCHQRRRLFCWICFGFRKAVEIVSPFVAGWGNDASWTAGRCYKAISKHEQSREHVTAVGAFFLFSQKGAVVHIVETQSVSLRRKQVSDRRDIVLRLINIIFFLGRQGLAFRGAGNEAAYTLHETSNHGNFLELVKSQAVFDPVLAAHVTKATEESKKRHEKNPKSGGRGNLVTFLSKSTLQRLLQIIGEMIQEYIYEEVTSNGGKYSLCVDSTQDVSVKEQTSIVLRFVDEYGPVERLLDVIETEDTTGEALFEAIVADLERLKFSLLDLLAYAFDGAPNMSGKDMGLRGLLQKLVPHSVYQHCYAHVLQLVMEESCSCVPETVHFFSLLRDSPGTISESHKRMGIWKNVLELVIPDASSSTFLVKVGRTRWWAKPKAMRRLFCKDKSLLPVMVVVLDIIARDTAMSGPVRAKAGGECLSWCKFETLAIGMLFQKIFSFAEQVSTYLQDKQLDYLQAARLTAKLIPEVASISLDDVCREAKELAVACNEAVGRLNRCDDFVETYEKANLSFSTEAVRRRIPVAPRQAGESAQDEMRQLSKEHPPEWHLKVTVLKPVQDLCLGELRRRFEGPSEGVFKSISYLNPVWFESIAANGIPDGALGALCTLANVDEDEAVFQLINFAKSYTELTRDINADFRPNNESADVDLSDEEDSYETDEENTTENGVKCAPDFSSCKGCLRCCYRLLKKYGFFTRTYHTLGLLYKCALALPCTQVTCERCFSKLKIVKTRLRNSMSSDTLRYAMLMAVERDITFSIDPVDVLERFAKSSSVFSDLLKF